MKPPTLLAALAAAVVMAVPAVPLAVQDTADAHLSKAQAILDKIPAEPNGSSLLVTRDDGEKAAERVANLKQRFVEMGAAYRADPSMLSTDWKLKFSEVERELARIIGGGSHAQSAVAAAETTAPQKDTSAVLDFPALGDPAIGIKELDPGIRKLLEMFRVEMELFYIAPPGERSSS